MGDTATGPRAVSLRLSAEAAAALDALTTAAGGRVPRHRLAVAALEHGARALAADPVALLRALGMGHLLAAVEAAPSPVVAPAPAVPARGVIHSVAVGGDGVTPSPDVPRRDAPRPRAVARGDASEQEVDAMVTALRGALERGASVNAVCTSAQMASGGTRRRLAALLDGERPAVSVALARAITSAADAFGRTTTPPDLSGT